MRLLLITLLAAISYAQTACEDDPIPGYSHAEVHNDKIFDDSTVVHGANTIAECANKCTEDTNCLSFTFEYLQYGVLCSHQKFDIDNVVGLGKIFSAAGAKTYTKCNTAEPSKNPTAEPSKNPTAEPSKNPTAQPTNAAGATASSHGDPIIWTFKNECYDLHEDGIYLASSHPHFSHDVYIAVYNDFIREIQITDNKGELLLSISNLNEIHGQWPYGFKHEFRLCRNPSWKECEFGYHQYIFDAQLFRYSVQIMFHDYLDPALTAGERGVHLDIYPVVYPKKMSEFIAEEYKGAYFDNPLPEKLPSCPANSIRRIRS